MIGAFSGWLFQIVRRECIRRAQSRARWTEFDEGAFAAASLGERSDADLRIDLSRAISSLPEGYREVLVLRDIRGLTSEEASERLGVPVAAAKSRLHRARQMVRSRLERTAAMSGSQRKLRREGKLCTSATRA